MQENKKSEIAKKEEEILEFWSENRVFEKTLKKESPKGEFIFYDGPPFATGLPHFGTLLAGTIKDAIPRFKTMQGYYVPRKWGWDCHGLPLENLIEDELGLKTKKDIEEYGVEKFNNAAFNAVLRYANEWKKVVPRVGRWVDMENDYRTMDTNYMESVWWVFKQLFDKGLVYNGFKSMHICPRCGTVLSNFEVNDGFKDIKDKSAYVKFKLKNEPKTFLLAWTTTPWTLAGNVALAMNRDIKYVKVSFKREEVEEKVILAKERLEDVFEEKEYEIIEELDVNDFIGLIYEPIFDYYKDFDFVKENKAWKIYEANFVEEKEGTGIVHIAPAFGEEDLELAKQEKLPLIHHVDEEGRFKSVVKDFAGMLVKPKDNPAETDEKILEFLTKKGSVFKTENVEHSYPHCWRCDTPLLNYATTSWFVEVSSFKEKLVSKNKNIKWVPEKVGSARFGNWLEGAKDWAISRSRYWGAPLPVWQSRDEKEIFVAGSVKELKERISPSDNKFFVMRHGEAESNVEGIVSSVPSNKHHLTEKGEEQVKEATETIKKKESGEIDMIIHSPFARTKETAQIVAEKLSLSADSLIEDARISEIDAGVFEGKSLEEYEKEFNCNEGFYKRSKDGESFLNVKKRVGDFIYEINLKYRDKNILIITHGAVFEMLFSVAKGFKPSEFSNFSNKMGVDFNSLASLRELDFLPIPHNSSYELDLHRPYIDEVSILDKKGDKMNRVPEVFDCWFESGSMPYGQFRYPFENKDKFEPKESKGFPADFIAEGLDQTRGWFYSLLVLSVAIFDEPAYKNVIVNGMTLGEDGKKMSKSVLNYADPSYIIDTYGADALRYYMLSSPLMKAEEYPVTEDGIDEISKKLIKRLLNVFSFYKTYSSGEKVEKKEDLQFSVLDKWICSRLYELIEEVTLNMENYELDKATRPILEFVDDLSTWYLRRSRDRFKASGEDKRAAIFTMENVLKTLSRLMAPFIPFFAEDLWEKLGARKKCLSVHLSNWPSVSAFEDSWIKELQSAEILKSMAEAREVVSKALEIRSQKGIKVRQPLRALFIKSKKIESDKEVQSIIKDEVNVKEIIFKDFQEDDISLDENITQDLKKEGYAREIVRKLQDLRKKENFNPNEKANLFVSTKEEGKTIIKEFESEIKEKPLLNSIEFKDLEYDPKKALDLGEASFIFELTKD